jgi:hypothetical protein
MGKKSFQVQWIAKRTILHHAVHNLHPKTTSTPRPLAQRIWPVGPATYNFAPSAANLSQLAHFLLGILLSKFNVHLE